MISLGTLLDKVEILRAQGSLQVQVDSLCIDHRRVVTGAMFIALCGSQVDGHTYVSAAIEAGASCVMVQQWPDHLPDEITCIQVANSALSLGYVASAFYGNPSQKLTLLGVTGTNGKTTTVTLLYQIFKGLGHRSGLISTVSCKIGDKEIPSTHTTPNAIELNNLLYKMVQEGCTHAFMEVSSHAMAQHRVSGLRFEGGIFTNLTRDHLDYHGTMENYFMAKRAFFDGLGKEAFALFNADDPYGRSMVSASSARCYAYGFEGEGIEPNSGGDAFWGKDMTLNASSIRYQVEGRDLSCGLSGKFNAYNTLAVYAAGRLLGKGAEDLQRVMQYLTPPSGRMQSVKGSDGRLGMVDYAHTPDALEQVLLTLKGIAGKGVRIITVIGCGGDRDRGKRPLMAAIAYKHSDALVLTSDNPRNEDPEQILNEMMTGIPDHAIVNGTSGAVTEPKTLIRQTDRAEAIRIAVQWTALGDIILVAGKGHETYQEIAGIRHPFDDVKILQEQFEHLGQLPESSSTKS